MNKSFSSTLYRLTIGGLILCALASAAGQLLGDQYPYELLLNFPLQYATIAGGGTLLLLTLKRKFAAALGAIFCGSQLALLLPFYTDAPPTIAIGRELKIMFANVLCTNSRYEEVTQLLQTESPDILVLGEFTAVWDERLSALQPLYPHQIKLPRNNAFGIALYSRTPLTQLQSPLTDTPTPSIVAKVKLEGREVTVIGTHTMPPVREPFFRRRNEQLRGISEALSATTGSAILLGDLNTTPWSPYYRELESKARLRGARRGYGLNSSWPANYTPWGIPIDHALVSAGISVKNFRTITIPGSDHDAIVASVVIP